MLILVSVVLKNKLGFIFTAFSLFALGFYMASSSNLKINIKNPVFLECKVISFPEKYYKNFLSDCKVLNSNNKNLINKEVKLISNKKLFFLSNVYILGKASIKHNKIFVKVVNLKEEKNKFLSPILSFRDYLIKNFKENSLNYISFSIGNALIFGDRSYIPQNIKKAFINTGLIHLLAISGLHIGLLIFILLFIFSFWDKRKSYLITILFLIFYPVITAFHIPVFRASLMGILYLYGKFKYLAINPMNILFFVAFISALIYPEVIFSVGFQLSFIAVFGLILSRKYIEIDIKNKFLKFFITSMLLSFFAVLWTTPLIIFYFHQFSPTSIFATTFEMFLLIPYLFLSVLNMFSLFLIKPLINIMDFIGLKFIELAKLFDSLKIMASNLDLNLIEVLTYYILLGFITINSKIKIIYKYILFFILFSFLFVMSKI
ncbi:ComEC/Rec2 family competence protein [Hydrogenothermus marinus]|uniref:ComEC/Rec2 family competence protein n=1 Tax=Hydrogenothermus marinus TaxID=133270 RepID=UPI00147616F8|nr:ComEC/Rec2 family competence protein [Hydrogenothermus marinus]